MRRPFHPSTRQGRGYRLPHDIRDRLAASLAPFRNREAAFALAVFLARFWSVPGRVSGSFPIDRRALTDHQDLQLTEARVRGAIKTLEAVGFLERAIPATGSQYKQVGEGLHRKPILFVFGSEYGPAVYRGQQTRSGGPWRRFCRPSTAEPIPRRAPVHDAPRGSAAYVAQKQERSGILSAYGAVKNRHFRQQPPSLMRISKPPWSG